VHENALLAFFACVAFAFATRGSVKMSVICVFPSPVVPRPIQLLSFAWRPLRPQSTAHSRILATTILRSSTSRILNACTTMSEAEHGGGIGGNGKKRKCRPGRASRRRNRKIKAIQEAEAALFASSVTSPCAAAAAVERGANNSQVLPADRHRSLPGVLERRRDRYDTTAASDRRPIQDGEDISLDHIRPGDERLLTSQLGFIPGNAVNVAARVEDCPSLHLMTTIDKYSTDTATTSGADPTVLRLYPLAIRDACPKRKYKSRQRGQIGVDGEKKCDSDANESKARESRDWVLDGDGDGESGVIEPFPTQYWLTDPRLRMLISMLEISDDRNVKTMEAKLRSNPEYFQRMERAHKSYGDERWSLLTDADRRAVTERRWDGSLSSGRGVAGISNPKGVKCLHAHAAHYLSGCEDNLVGKWTIQEVGRMLQEKMGVGEGDKEEEEEEEEDAGE